MPAASLPDGLIDRCAPEARPALALLADNAALALRAGPAEIEIWAENADGKRVKVGGCSFAAEAAGAGAGGLYLAHVFVVTRRLAEAATALGFAAEVGPGGRRLWVLDEGTPPARFAEALTAFLGLEAAGGGDTAPRARLPLRPETLFGPRAITVIGADDTGLTPAGAALASLRQAGFQGKLTPVAAGEGVARLQGLPAAASVAEAGAADLALIGTDDPGLCEALRALAAGGTRAAMVLPAADPAADGGLALRRELADIAEETGLAILGPSAAGLVHAPARLAVGPAAAALPALPLRDGTGGAFAALLGGPAFATHLAAAAAQRGMAPRSLLGIGGAADLGLAEGLELLLGESGAAGLPILIVPEACPAAPGSGAALAALLERARRAGRPVIVVRADQVAEPAMRLRQAAPAAAEPAVPDPLGAIFAQCGAVEAPGFAAALDLILACRARRLPKGRRLGLVTPPEALEPTARMLGPAASSAGLDLRALPLTDAGSLGSALAKTLTADGIDLILGVWPAPGHDGAPALLEALAEAAEAAWDLGAAAPPMLHATLLPADMQALANEAQIAVYPDAHAALATAAGMATLGVALARQASAPPRLPLRARLAEDIEEEGLETALSASLAALSLPLRALPDAGGAEEIATIRC
ncbi:MAG: CoA-binding protein, partial [Pseudomonadota bacterium]